MKVAYFSGCIEYSICLANSLSQQVDVDFYYSGSYVKSRDESILELIDKKVKKIEINNYRTRSLRNLYDYMLLARRMNSYDIVHVQAGSIWLHLFKKLIKTPMVCTVHDPTQHFGTPKLNKIYQDIAQKVMVSQSNKIIVHGNQLKNDLIDFYKRKSEDVFIIPHGEFSFYNRWDARIKDAAADNTEKKILFFGEVRKNKGLEYLIKAEKYISEKVHNYKIVIAGKFFDEPENNYKYYESMILNKDKFVIIDRYIPNDEVGKLFKESTIVVLPYISASQSGILPIAFAYGKPVVATNVGSLREVLENNKAGFLVPPCNPLELANALSDLLLDDKKCHQFGEYAKKLANDTLSWDKIALKTIDVYESCRKSA